MSSQKRPKTQVRTQRPSSRPNCTLTKTEFNTCSKTTRTSMWTGFCHGIECRKKRQEIAQCCREKPTSLFASLLLCAEHGLSPSPEVGEAWPSPTARLVSFNWVIRVSSRLPIETPNRKHKCRNCLRNGRFWLGSWIRAVPESQTRIRPTREHYLRHSVVKFRDASPMFKVMSERGERHSKIWQSRQQGDLVQQRKRPARVDAEEDLLKQLLKLVPRNSSRVALRQHCRGGVYSLWMETKLSKSRKQTGISPNQMCSHKHLKREM